MDAKHLHNAQALDIDLDGLWTECGMIPGGGLWFVPTETFFVIWATPVGAHLRKRGFRIENDGKAFDASQDCVVHIDQDCVGDICKGV